MLMEEEMKQLLTLLVEHLRDILIHQKPAALQNYGWVFLVDKVPIFQFKKKDKWGKRCSSTAHLA
jgi:hypothetical protein